MATHNFNYTYEYVGVKTMPLSREDNTQIVREVCVAVTAVDQADGTQTMTENMYSPLEGVYSCLLYTSPSPRDVEESRMPSSA